jgi:thioredoxin-dependent peroxiredoxin
LKKGTGTEHRRQEQGLPFGSLGASLLFQLANPLHFHGNMGGTFMGDWIEEGEAAPDFTLSDDRGAKVKLSACRGTPVVLYFYPKDDTPGCTREACAFRDRKAEIAKAGVKILGISPDTVESHAEFRDKFTLNFPLLADIGHKVAERYGAWREKNMYGKKTMGIQRSTFLIDRDGQVAKTWKSVQVDGHDGKVLEAVAALG